MNEQTLRLFTVEKYNWLFSSSVKDADANVAIFSLIETAKVNYLDLYEYIEYLLEIMPNIDFLRVQKI